MSEQDPNGLVSVEDANGRILTGVGVPEASLQETMEAREPADATPVEVPSPALPETATPAPRDPQSGKFKPSRADKRIGQLTAQKSEETQKREAAEQRASDLERRLAALEASRAIPVAPTPSPSRPEPVQAPPAAQEPDFEQYEAQVGEKYQTYGAAVQAYNRDFFNFHKTNTLDAQIRAGIEADRASRAQIEYVQSFGQRARSVYPDFDAVLASAEEIQFPDLKLLINAPNAEHLVYALAKNPQLARSIAQERDPIKLGYLMASVQGSNGSAPPASPPKTIASSAPAPYQPVGSSTKTSTPSLDELAAKGSDYDSSGYRERRAQERTRGGRFR